MNTENVKLFRSSIGGFHREDVTNYIKETDQKYTEEIAKLKQQVNDAEGSVETLEAQCAELEQTLSAERKRAEALEEALAKEETARKEEAIKYHTEEEELRCAMEKAEATIAELEQKIMVPAESVTMGDLNDHNSPAYKLAMYDRISAQLGDILINTNRNADDILTAAREEAEKIRADAENDCSERRTKCEEDIARIRTETAEEAAYIRKRLAETATSLLSAIGTDLHGNMENCIREMNSCIVDMQYELQTMLARIVTRSEEMNDRISYYQGCVGDEVEKKLSGFDDEYGISGDSDRTEKS